MSTTFNLSGTTFDHKSWDGQLQSLLRGEVGWIPLACMERFYPEGVAEPLKKDGILLLGKGSSRGVHVTSRDTGICLELRVLASEVDWDAARWLLTAGYKLGAEVTGDEGQRLGAEDLKSENFRALSQKVLQAELAMTHGIMAKDGSDEIRFPVAYFELRLPKENLEPLVLGPLMDSLVKQCYSYGNAYIASRMEWQLTDGTRSGGAHYSSIATMVPKDAQWMTFSGPDGHYTDNPVPIEKVNGILAEFITPMGNYLHFPAIPWDRRPELLEALAGKSMDEILQSLNEQLVGTLTRLPVLIFVLTALADGEVDQKETRVFFDFVQNAAANENDQTSFAAACRRLFQEMKQTIAGVKGLDHAAELQFAVRQLDLRLSPEAGMVFKKRLYELAEAVAEGSGGGFLGMGAKISDAEKQALARIQKTLFPSGNQ